LGEKPPEAQQLDFYSLRGQGEDSFQRLANTLGGNTYAQGAWQASEESRMRADRLAQMAEEMAGVSDQAAAGVSQYATPLQQAAMAAAGRMDESGAALGSLAGRINYDPTAIERELERQAVAELGQGRSLTPEQQRDAAQSARQAFAARGMATGLGASAAEILNRDAYAQQRQDQRRQFASGVNAANQAARLARLGMGGDLRAQQANIYGNAGQLRASGLGQAANIMGAAGEMRMRGRESAASTMGNAGNMAMQRAQLINAISPYTQALGGGGYQAGIGLAGNTQTFNANMLEARRNNWMNNMAALQAAQTTGQAATQAGWMGMIGGLGQGLGSAFGGTNFSDKRMKKDIKPVGKDGVLGLKTYEYRFKGESKDAPKHTGFMAQEVQKVLPEAVEEVDYKGKKRLAIKPQVIGQALAAAIATQQDAMFEQGYTVGRGFGQ